MIQDHRLIRASNPANTKRVILKQVTTSTHSHSPLLTPTIQTHPHSYPLKIYLHSPLTSHKKSSLTPSHNQNTPPPTFIYPDSPIKNVHPPPTTQKKPPSTLHQPHPPMKNVHSPYPLNVYLHTPLPTHKKSTQISNFEKNVKFRSY